MGWQERFRELLRDAGIRSDKDAIRRFNTKRSSGERRQLDTDADKPQLRRCSGCHEEMIEGEFARMIAGKCRDCRGESGGYRQEPGHDGPRAA
jgi:hypothetical protein